MAITVNSGLVDDLDILQAERVIDMAPEIAMLEEDMTQFTTMLMKARSRPAFSSIVHWLEDQLFPRLSSLAASATTAAGTVTVASGEGTYFRSGDVVKVTTTGEVMAVSAAPSSDTVGVTRSIGSVAAATAASGAELIIIGNAAAQGATLGARIVTERVEQYNYTQIFRTPYGFTNTLQASKLYGQSDARSWERKKKAVEHKRAIEYALFIGARDLNSSGSTPIGYMGGLSEYVTTNLHDAGGTMTKTELDTYMRDDLQFANASSVVLFVSPVAAQAISSYAADNWVRATPGVKTWGVKIDGYLSGAYGFQIPTVVKRDWNDFAANQHGLGGSLWSVDMSHVSLRPLRTTRLLLDRQANDADEVTDEFLTELTLQVEVDEKHAKVYGITG